MKLCICGCGDSVFSNHYGKRCQYKRTDDKWIKSQARRKGNYNSESKRAYPEKKEYTDYDFFIDIWNNLDKKEKVSFVSGEDLRRYEDTKLFVNLFHHLLIKKLYKRFRFYFENIILLSPQEHMDRHSKTKEDLLKQDVNWIKVFEKEDYLKELYNSNPQLDYSKYGNNNSV